MNPGVHICWEICTYCGVSKSTAVSARTVFGDCYPLPGMWSKMKRLVHQDHIAYQRNKSFSVCMYAGQELCFGPKSQTINFTYGLFTDLALRAPDQMVSTSMPHECSLTGLKCKPAGFVNGQCLYTHNPQGLVKCPRGHADGRVEYINVAPVLMAVWNI